MGGRPQQPVATAAACASATEQPPGDGAGDDTLVVSHAAEDTFDSEHCELMAAFVDELTGVS